MPSLRLSRLIRRDPDRLTLKQRAAALRATAAKAMRRRSVDGTPRSHEDDDALPPVPRDLACSLVHGDGTVSYCDAGGAIHREPVAAWIEFTAQRLYSVAHSEMARQAADPALVGGAWDAARDRARRELRVDALRILVGRWREAFEAAREAPHRAPDPAAVLPAASADDPVHAAITAHQAAYAEMDRLCAIWGEIPSNLPEYEEARIPAGDASRAETAAFDALLATPATTAVGLRLLIEYLPTATRQASVEGGNNDEQRALDAIRSSLRALEEEARIVSEPQSVVKLPPVGDLLAASFMKEWASYAALTESDESGGGEQADAALDRAIDRRSAMIDAADRLPARKSALLVKSLALAWLGYVEHWRTGQRREEYDIAGRLAFDVHTIVSGGAAAVVDAAPDYSGLPEPRLVVAGLDFAAQPLGVLQALHEAAETIEQIAYAIGCQPKCLLRDEGYPTSNAAGHLVDWLADVMNFVMDGAADAARDRQPADDEVKTRMAILARTTVTSGDPRQLRGLAADLHAEAGRLARG